MNFKEYKIIDKELLNKESQNIFTISGNNWNDHYNFRSVLWNVYKNRENGKSASQTNIGYAYRLTNALIASDDPKKYKTFVGAWDFDEKNSELTNLEKTLLKTPFNIIAWKVKEGVKIVLSNGGLWDKRKGLVTGVIKPTFSEAISILNQMYFNANNFKKIEYWNHISKALKENSKENFKIIR